MRDSSGQLSRPVLHLLVPTSEPGAEGDPRVELGGRLWTRRDFSAVPPEEIPAYTCVSYAWGAARTEHPFSRHETMSSRTVSAAEATLRRGDARALWIDALCVPFEEPEKSRCLRALGAVYSGAAQVVVVLSSACVPLLTSAAADDSIDEASLTAFENDAWVTRVWNYQELVNGNEIHFVAEGSDVSVEAEQALNRIGHAIEVYKRQQGYGSFTFRREHPRLDSLEDLILDWRTSSYLERSVYQVMSSMHQQEATYPEDFFYAMVAAIESPSSAPVDRGPIHPAEELMQICESKGDFSFLYSDAPRSRRPGKRWRPTIVDRLRPVFAWHSYGDGQAGALRSTHLELDGMATAVPATLAADAAEFVAGWMPGADPDSSRQPEPSLVLERLRRAGFSSSGEHLELETGFYFPHRRTPLPADGEGVFVAIATGVRMPFGAPALLLRRRDSGIHELQGLGLFVGAVAPVGECIRVG